MKSSPATEMRGGSKDSAVGERPPILSAFSPRPVRLGSRDSAVGERPPRWKDRPAGSGMLLSEED